MKFLTFGLLLASTIVSVSSAPTDVDSRAVRTLTLFLFFLSCSFENHYDQHLENREERKEARDISVPSFVGVETTSSVIADVEEDEAAKP
ncbi:hypothetical protein CH063_08139, partial [Colletotrichum higginsianum]